MAARISPIILSARIEIIRRDESPNLVEVVDGSGVKIVDPGDLARYISTVLTGLAVQAANGSTRAEMTRLVEMALRSMPF